MTGRYLYNVLRILKRKFSKRPESIFTLQSILEKNFPPPAEFCFILVGANDGVSHDFLFDFLKQRQCKGIAIEPVKEYYQQLVSNFSVFPFVKLVNKAVHPAAKEITIYKADPAKLPTLPNWASGIASLDPLHHKKSGLSITDIIEEKVEADHLMNIISQNHNDAKVDLLQIDTEGYDFEILKQVDFKLIQPAIIKFEYTNLSESDTNLAIQFLKGKKYYCFYDDVDIVALKINQLML